MAAYVLDRVSIEQIACSAWRNPALDPIVVIVAQAPISGPDFVRVATLRMHCPYVHNVLARHSAKQRHVPLIDIGRPYRLGLIKNSPGQLYKYKFPLSKTFAIEHVENLLTCHQPRQVLSHMNVSELHAAAPALKSMGFDLLRDDIYQACDPSTTLNTLSMEELMPTYELLNSLHGALPALLFMDFKYPFLGVEEYCEALGVKNLAEYLDAAVGRPEFHLPWIASVIATLRQANQLSTISETFMMTQAKLCRYGYLRKEDLKAMPGLARYFT
jgi:hypothetical protein